VKVTMLLADYAQVAEGKLNIVGGGWTITGPGPCTGGVAVQIRVPWDQTNRRHRWELALLDADGKPVLLQSDPETEGQSLQIGNEFEVGRPAGVLPGSFIEHHFAFNFAGLPLASGQRYVWELRINGHTDEDWRLPFSTRRMPVQLAS
jgi:hypothetical protein